MLVITGATDCPAPEEVSKALSEIVVLAEGPALEERARVERDGPSVRVMLESKTGAVVASRTLHAEGTCEELASATAVVLASWLGDAYPELLSAAPASAVPAPVAPIRQKPRPAATAAPQRVAPPKVAPRWRGRAPNAHRIAPSVGLGAAISSEGAAPLAAFGASWIARTTSLGVWIGLALSAVQEQPLGRGVVRWSRWPAMAGPVLRFDDGTMRADLAAGGAIAWLRLEGEGFSADANAEDTTYGAFVAAKIFGGRKVIEPFLGVNAVIWAKGATAYLNTRGGPEFDLPAAELWLLAGIAVEP